MDEGQAFSLGLIISMITAVILCLVMFNTCGTYKISIDTCQQACEDNGGLKQIYFDDDCQCNNGAHFNQKMRGLMIGHIESEKQ